MNCFIVVLFLLCGCKNNGNNCRGNRTCGETNNRNADSRHDCGCDRDRDRDRERDRNRDRGGCGCDRDREMPGMLPPPWVRGNDTCGCEEK